MFYCLIVLWMTTTTLVQMMDAAASGENDTNDATTVMMDEESGGGNVNSAASVMEASASTQAVPLRSTTPNPEPTAPHHLEPRAMVIGGVNWVVKPGGYVQATWETILRLRGLAIALVQGPMIHPPFETTLFETRTKRAALLADLGTVVRDMVEAWDQPERWAAPYPTLAADASDAARKFWHDLMAKLGAKLRLRCEGDYENTYSCKRARKNFGTFGYDVLMLVMDFNRRIMEAAESDVMAASPSASIAPVTDAAAALGGGSVACACDAQHQRETRAMVIGPVNWQTTPDGDVEVTQPTWLRLTELGNAVVQGPLANRRPLSRETMNIEYQAKLGNAVRNMVEAWDKPEVWAGPYIILAADDPDFVRGMWEQWTANLSVKVQARCDTGVDIDASAKRAKADFATFGYDVLMRVKEFNKQMEKYC